MVQIFPLPVSQPLVPEDAERQTLSGFVLGAIRQNGLIVESGDVLCLSSKIAGLYEGRTVRLDSVVPSRRARWLARIFEKDPRKMELMIRSGKVAGVMPMRRMATKRGGAQAMDRLATDPRTRSRALALVERFEFFMAMHGALINEAGIDIMNSPPGYVSQLPEAPGRTAADLRRTLKDALGFSVPVIITDTVAPIGRLGTVDVAIGFSGLAPVERKLIAEDLFGDLRPGGANIIVDSIAAIAGAVMGQTTEMTPMALVRGCDYTPEEEDDFSSAERCMERLSYPQGTVVSGTLLTVLCTVWYHLVSFVVSGPRFKR
ncbi:coenzyme F420-0:L-glutamate ligase [Candidatus Bipolaricaulota bacterium]|nr:coenzyme F420-0:L-glutamate ligase [Candidatus Bipolaricaulota bacterium]